MAQQQALLENTFQLPSDTFPVSKIKAEVEKILTNKFDKTTYDTKQSSLTLKEATDEIGKCVKRIAPARFKFSVQLVLSEKIGQAFFSGSMCLWDEEHDNYVTTTYETSTFLVVAVIFGSLLE
ncbi:outer arm dynein light chain 2 [Tritrichomonas foetus]|uniref:Outer arm dynein light chain 2 n=1 Tax=Tritrichomonas foetus TaxID=1144522 RepID=A0A1J4KI46_9EUKA|nr:outer arm dynein light chain 2 [Tritrichomonas foetus]|eukprot:OHT10891.1 outer arm dynein light chain 2 [Tritrichomonas foetus]